MVMIGILLALQVNNWNEARKAKLKEEAILKNLVQDLRADSLSFNENLESLKQINALHQALYEIGIKGLGLEVENPNLIRYMIYYNPIAIKNDPLISEKISREEIRNEIKTYFRNLIDLDDGFSQFQELMEKRIRVFLADQNVQLLSNWFENKGINKKGISSEFIDKEGLRLLTRSPKFQQLLLEASIKCKNVEFNLEIVLAQNQKLIELIQKELKQ